MCDEAMVHQQRRPNNRKPCRQPLKHRETCGKRNDHINAVLLLFNPMFTNSGMIVL